MKNKNKRNRRGSEYSSLESAELSSEFVDVGLVDVSVSDTIDEKDDALEVLIEVEVDVVKVLVEVVDVALQSETANSGQKTFVKKLDEIAPLFSK